MSKIRDAVRVTIANGASLSGPVAANGRRIIGIQMPAGWTAADLSIQAQVRSDTFGEVVDAGGTNLVLATGPGADEYVAFADTAALHGLGIVKIRSGTAGAPVAQAADRVLFLVLGD